MPTRLKPRGRRWPAPAVDSPRPAVDDVVAVVPGRPDAGPIDHLSVHGRAHPRLHVLALRLAHPAEQAQANREMSGLLDLIAESLSQGAMSSAEATLRVLGCIGSKTSGAGTVSAAGALYLASRSAARPLSGLLIGAFAPDADTDTLASMTGGLLGAIHGVNWLGDLAKIQDTEYLFRLAAKLVDPTVDIGLSEPSKSPQILRSLLEESLDIGGPSATDRSGEFPNGRTYRVHDVVELEGNKPVARARLELSDGQTAVIDRIISARRITPRAQPDGRGAGVHPKRLNSLEKLPS
jgi:ADP-ribosylglycohydrolase